MSSMATVLLTRKKDPYAFEAVGRNYFDLERSSQIGPEHLVVYHHEGDEIRVTAGDRGVRFLLYFRETDR